MTKAPEPESLHNRAVERAPKWHQPGSSIIAWAGAGWQARGRVIIIAGEMLDTASVDEEPNEARRARASPHFRPAPVTPTWRMGGVQAEVCSRTTERGCDASSMHHRDARCNSPWTRAWRALRRAAGLLGLGRPALRPPLASIESTAVGTGVWTEGRLHAGGECLIVVFMRSRLRSDTLAAAGRRPFARRLRVRLQIDGGIAQEMRSVGYARGDERNRHRTSGSLPGCDDVRTTLFCLAQDHRALHGERDSEGFISRGRGACQASNARRETSAGCGSSNLDGSVARACNKRGANHVLGCRGGCGGAVPSHPSQM
jgi:hypothetical protein